MKDLLFKENANLELANVPSGCAVESEDSCCSEKVPKHIAGLTIVETLVAIVLGLLIVGIAFFVYNKGKASEEQSSIQQVVGTLFGAIDTAKSDNGGYYPAGTVQNLGSFQVQQPTSGNNAAGLLGSALCPNIPNGQQCNVPQMSKWSYSCNPSNGSPTTATVTIVVPDSEAGLLNGIQTNIQQTYSGWNCTQQNNTTLLCSISNVICQ